MTDAVVLLAISQVICLGAVVYLYTRVTALQRRVGGVSQPARRKEPAMYREGRPPVLAAAAAPANGDVAALVTRMHELGIDLPTVARRMHRTEDEVRSLLRGHGVRA